MKTKQTGFTLVELIAVLAILGILAAVAVPKFVDLSDAASQAAVDGVAGALASASALNHAANIAKDNGVDSSLTIVDTSDGCTGTVAGNLLDGGLDTDYTISGPTTVAEGASISCTVTGKNSKTASFILYGVE